MIGSPSHTKRLSAAALAAIEADIADGGEATERQSRTIRRLLDHIAALAGDDPNDPLTRQHDEEPRFVLLARDPLSDGMVALWAALRMRRTDAVPGIVRNLVVHAGQLPYQPDKDPEHAMNARQISNAMGLWRVEHVPRAPKTTRQVNLGILDDPNDQEVG